MFLYFSCNTISGINSTFHDSPPKTAFLQFSCSEHLPLGSFRERRSYANIYQVCVRRRKVSLTENQLLIRLPPTDEVEKWMSLRLCWYCFNSDLRHQRRELVGEPIRVSILTARSVLRGHSRVKTPNRAPV